MPTDKPVYIHYGHDQFRLPDPIRNRDYFTKPKGGLWASRKDGEHNWIDWCECEKFCLDTFDQSFEFTLADHANILVLDDLNKLDNLPKIDYGEKYSYKKENEYSECYLDFEKLKQDWDAIELTEAWMFHWALYGWDCNCILILNPGIVEVIERKDDVHGSQN